MAPPHAGHLRTDDSKHSPPFTVPSTSVNDSDCHVEGGFYEKYAKINHVIAPEWGAYKKNNKMATVSARTIKKYVH